MSKNINAILADMRKAGKMADNKSKGNLGEDAVLALCYERMQKVGKGLLYQSFCYPYQTDENGVCYTGNIVRDQQTGAFTEYTNDHLQDEIDVLYITPYRVFPIEVKSYGRARLDVSDLWFARNGQFVTKSPIAQAEKHARHLYHAIYSVLPDGSPEYIKPMVCFVDNCHLRQERNKYFMNYIPVCVLNNFLSTLQKYNVPAQYNLDLPAIERQLNEVKVSVRKKL